MSHAIRLSILIALSLSMFHCRGEQSGQAEEEIISQEITGGDTTAQVIQLDYQELDLPDRHYLVFRQELAFPDINGFFGMEGEALSAAATRAGVVATGPMSSLTYKWDTERGWGDVAVALPVAEGTQLPPYVTITLPAGKAIALEWTGTYDRLSAMHVSLDQELRRRGLKPVYPSVEEYPVGPLQVADPHDFQTRIIYAYETPAQ